MSLRIGIFSNTVELGLMVVRNLLIKLLREHYSGASLVLICEEKLMDRARTFHEAASWVDEYVAIEVTAANSTPERNKLLDQIARLNLDVFVFSPMSSLPCWVPSLCGIQVRVGLEVDHNQRHYLTHPVTLDLSPEDRTLHWSQVLTGYVQALELPNFKGVAAHVPFVRLPEMRQRFPAIVSDAKIVIHAGGSGNRRWPLTNFILLCRRLIREANATILLIGCDETTENRLICEALQKDGLGARVFNLSRNGIDETIGWLAEADLFIGHDSGPMNLAVAVGTPIVAIRGVDPDNFSPSVIDPRHTVFSGWKNCGRFANGAHVCDRGCPVRFDPLLPEYPRCMASITLEQVWPAVRQQLNGINAVRPS
jgi:ADP-heptose:LPS heptosyltransferase